jgi:hypothetical protein
MQNDTTAEPDWDTQISLSTTPALLIHALFGTANSIHTGWSSCIDDSLAQMELVATNDSNGDYCRLVEQEYIEDENDEIVWRDWAVELRLGDVFIIGHWQIQATTSPMDWDWCAREAEKAFDKGCLLFGKRVRRSIVVEELERLAEPSQSKRH